nr:agamous-like MADS-box protein AGL62 [Tanacetum cinerariifolium]
MVVVNNMSKKTSQGHKKIEIKKIEENSHRQVTFSKRRNGLFKKAAELCVLTGAKIAIIVNSTGGRVFAFGHPNVDALINTYLAVGKDLDVDVDLDVGQSALPMNEFNQHYDEVSRELELEKKRKDMISKKTGTEFWYDEPIDGMDVAELEQYLSSLQELNRKVLTRTECAAASAGTGTECAAGSARTECAAGSAGTESASAGTGTECAAGSARTECAAGSAGTECGAGSAGTEYSKSTGSIGV